MSRNPFCPSAWLSAYVLMSSEIQSGGRNPHLGRCDPVAQKFLVPVAILAGGRGRIHMRRARLVWDHDAFDGDGLHNIGSAASAFRGLFPRVLILCSPIHIDTLHIRFVLLIQTFIDSCARPTIFSWPLPLAYILQECEMQLISQDDLELIYAPDTFYFPSERQTF